MYEFLWFAAGCAVTVPTLMWWVKTRREPKAPPPTISSTEPLVELYAESKRAERLETLATSIGREVADLTSSVEINASLLIEEIGGDPRVASERAVDLYRSVHRMRFFINKLLSFAEAEPLPLGATDVTQLLLDLRRELEGHSPDGLRVDVVTGSALPLAMAEETSLRNALLFLVQALLVLEPNVGGVSLHASTGIDEDENPTVEIEIQVESDETRTAPQPSPERLQIDFAAARNLLQAQNGTLSLDHTPGLNATVHISLAATTRAATASPFGPPPAAERHDFGGVLVLEDDPSIRAIVSGELKATDRNIFACSDGASARSLFTATPERFELLILNGAARLERGDQLALDAMGINPDVKVLLLSTGIHAPPNLPEAYLPRLRVLRKPFGIDELRAMIRSLLESPAGCTQDG